MRARALVVLCLIVAVAAVGVAVFFKPLPLPGLDKPLIEKVILGLDLRGGTRLVLRCGREGEHVAEEDVRRVREIISYRIDRLEVREAAIQVQEGNRIAIELPGIKNPEEAKRVIGKTAKLEFRDESGNVIVTGAYLEHARAFVDEKDQFAVLLKFNAEGSRMFAEAAQRNVGRRILILLDGEVIRDPVVQEADWLVAPERVTPHIAPYATMERANADAIMLNSGALPVNVDILEEWTIGPTLGQESLVRSARAGIIGGMAVALFMLVLYRFAGVVADFALAVYILLVLGVFVALGATLTLPGIAGFVLSVGMAVDANVIIFERIKEEFGRGRPARSALEVGFTRALGTIFDSNVTTLLAAGVLFWLGTGPVKGFAVTLSIGILVSMFTAIVLTRWILRLLLAAGLFEKPSLILGIRREQG